MRLLQIMASPVGTVLAALKQSSQMSWRLLKCLQALMLATSLAAMISARREPADFGIVSCALMITGACAVLSTCILGLACLHILIESLSQDPELRPAGSRSRTGSGMDSKAKTPSRIWGLAWLACAGIQWYLFVLVDEIHVAF